MDVISNFVNNSDDKDERLYFKVENIKFKDLYDFGNDSDKERTRPRPRITQYPRHGRPSARLCSLHNSSAKSGTTVNVNLTQLALFRVRDTVYAIQEKCPHAGGPLHMGDIEDLGKARPCVRCPYHGWKFDLRTGACRVPGPGARRRAEVYPVRVDCDGSLWVGFSAFHSLYFTELVL